MITRDQKRARHAYDRVRALDAGLRDEYKTLLFALGPNVMRSGLAAALAFVEREVKAGEQQPEGARGRAPGAVAVAAGQQQHQRDGRARAAEQRTSAAEVFLRDVATFDLPGLAGAGADLPARVRQLGDIETYMLATREVLALTVWFRRAVQALFREPDDAPRTRTALS